MQGVLAQEVLSHRDSGGIVALLFEEGHQALRGLEKHLVQAIPFGENPLLVATGKEVATIQTSGVLQCPTDPCQVLNLFRMRGGGQCPLKLLDIEREGHLWGRVPGEALSLGGHKMAGVRERLAQVIEQLAQIGMSLRLRRIGPEEKGQVRAILGSTPMQHEVGQQGLDAGNRDRGHRCFTRHQQEVTQQRQVEGRNHQQLPFSDPGNRFHRVLQIAWCASYIDQGGIK